MPAAGAADAAPGVGTRTGWDARLELTFQRRDTRTVLARRRHEGPLMVQSPFYPEGAPCHVYLLHPPGGLVAGDRLDVQVRAEPASHALVTTPAASKLYRSEGAEAVVRQQLAVCRDAILEWLPGESIVFDGARCDLGTGVDLEPGARLLAWESWILGRPACQEVFARGRFRQRLEVRLDGVPLLVERNAADGGSPWLSQPWGLGGRAAAGTLVAWPADATCADAARDAAARVPGEALTGVTLVDGLLVCRALAAGLAALRARLEAWWRILRPRVAGRDAVAPRVWAT